MEKDNISDSYYFYCLFYFSKPFNHNVISVTVNEVIIEEIAGINIDRLRNWWKSCFFKSK